MLINHPTLNKKNMNRVNGFKGVKQLSLAIILMYDHLDYELLLLIQKVFVHLQI